LAERRANLDRLRSQVEDLDRQLDSGAERIFAAPAALVGRLTGKLDELRQQREILAAKLETVSRKAEPDDEQRRQAEALAGVDVLRNLRRSFAEARPDDLRRLLTTLISRIDLRFEHEPQGKKVRHRFVEGRIALRPAISTHLKRIVPSSGT
jgi:chromosome segregation ATPase